MIASTDLRYFMEIARTKNFSRSAERLGVTQPALSHCVKRLEKELGIPLFIRSKRGVELTAAGTRFAQEANDLLRQWKTSLRNVRAEILAPQGEVRLGCHTAVAQYTLPSFLPDFLRKYPEIRIRLQHGLSRHLTEQVISSGLEVAIVVNPVAHSELIVKEICRDNVTVWKSKDCRNPKLLLLEPSLLQTQEILRKLEKEGTHFESFMESSSLEVIAQLLVAGVGAAILPERVVRAFGGNRIEKVPGAPVFQDRVCLVYKPGFRKTKRGEVFISDFQKSFR